MSKFIKTKLLLLIVLSLGIPFIPGSLTLCYKQFTQTFPLGLSIAIILIGTYGLYLIVPVLQIIMSFPSKVLDRARSIKGRKKIFKNVLYAALYPLQIPIFKEVLLKNLDEQKCLLSLFIALKTEDWPNVEYLASQCMQSKTTERIGKMYLVAYYDHLRNYDTALTMLFQIRNQFFHTHKEEICLNNLIFKEAYQQIIKEDSLDWSESFQTELEQTLDETRLSLLISAKIEHSKKPQKYSLQAYALDHDNVIAACYVMKYTDSLEFKQKNQDLIRGFCQNPNFQWIECLEDINTNAGFVDIFNHLETSIKKLNSITPEHFYGLAYTAIQAGLEKESEFYLQKLNEIFENKKSPRLLKLDYLKQKAFLTSNQKNWIDEIISSPYQDVFYCHWCHSISFQHLDFCPHCAMVRSLSWQIRCKVRILSRTN